MRPGARPRRPFVATLLIVALVVPASARAAGSVHAAVATNFLPTARALGEVFEADRGTAVVWSDGSTGKLYAQIVNGAPFAVFLSADAERPKKLEAEGHAVAGTRRTYALGRLTLYSAKPGFVRGEVTLRQGDFRHLAIANPELAPYGAAARDVLVRLGLLETLGPRLVRGEDVGQTFAFVASGAAELGFVALSQAIRAGGGSRWDVPAALHAPLEQQAVLLGPGRDDVAARAFLDFLASARARALIESAGYALPVAP